MPCRLLLADDHEIVRKNLREIIELKTDSAIVGEAPKGLPLAINALSRDQPYFGTAGSGDRPSRKSA
jgi:DNA-binding NarL/FixJ family response regulator